MSLTDFEILRRAHERENDTRNRAPVKSWSAYHIGASRQDINRLLEEELIQIYIRPSRIGPGEYSATRYTLTEKGRHVIFAATMEREFAKVPAERILESMAVVIGWDDVKETIARAIEVRRRTHFLLEGPPACAKSVILEGIRTAVPDSYPAFGSQTSAAGLSDLLFENQPGVLLLDEADKMKSGCFSIMLGLMESGEILETKSQKTRGIRLPTIVIAACNSSERFPKEFLSRFSLHVYFPEYTRDEFIDVVRGFLPRVEDCPLDLADFIGKTIYDYGLGDVRKARAVWNLMMEPTEEEARRIIMMHLKYSPDNHVITRKTPAGKRLPGM